MTGYNVTPPAHSHAVLQREQAEAVARPHRFWPMSTKDMTICDTELWTISKLYTQHVGYSGTNQEHARQFCVWCGWFGVGLTEFSSL